MQYENEEFVNEFRDFIHGQHELSISERAEEKLQKDLEKEDKVKIVAWRQVKIDKGKKADKNRQKKIEDFKNVQLMTFAGAIDRQAAWLALAPYQRAQQMSGEWDYWVKQLRTHNARNSMSYRRNGATGIVGKKYVLRDKMQYLVDYLKDSEGVS